MLYTYILFSESHKRYYFGSTSDLANRLLDHKKGKVKYTRPLRPWRIHYYEEFMTRSEAIKRERFFKSIDGYRFLRDQKIIVR